MVCPTPRRVMGIDTQIKRTLAPINRHGNFNFVLRYRFRHDALQSDLAIAHFIYRNDFVQRSAPKCFVYKQSAGYGSSTSPDTTGKSRRTSVDATPVLDELIERLGMALVFQCVSQSAGPF